VTGYPAPAKINLHLRVTGIRADGYHELDTSFAYVDVFDHLDIRPARNIEVTCSIPGLSGENNLVFRVLEAMRGKFGVESGLSVHIDKQLPAQAGLGGGSSDAATALLVANSIWNLNLSTDQLIDFAAPFGADIPCFLFGEASIASGIGERLARFPGKLPMEHILLAYPGTGLSTPAVFSHFDSHHPSPDTLTLQSGVDTIRARSEIVIGDNDLEASATALSRDVESLLKEMRSVANRTWMSGSGSTCIALFDGREQAETESRRLLEKNLASWTHVGRLLKRHPVMDMKIGA